MDQVYDKIYVGGFEDVKDEESMSDAKITHVLSLLDRPLPPEIQNKYKCKFIRVLDMPDENLLTYFPECLRFIDEARVNGAVIVHCLVGCSRSATVVIAWLMQKKQLDVKTALNMVKDCRPCIRPNTGFQFQLELFARMAYDINVNNSDYKTFKLNMFGLKLGEGKIFNNDVKNLLVASPTENHPKTEVLYKCKKCRHPLFRESSLLSHTTGDWERSFDWNSKLSNLRKSDSEKNKVTCKESLFVEPVQWMADVVTNQSGKLTCPKCLAKIGSFIWCGEKCPCGSWVAPAFHIQKNKVDLCRPFVLVPRVLPNNQFMQETVATSCS
ncbi:dual specificity protein phosphatase 12 [Octopus sinensis]|uniref:Dual specificity protein phosphatase 12 n=1 Tax=Octopus sinensis TaxID=2607531 RepID=A0A6P7TJC3_9MOLL|nr:dual specificity protein phosphatase 12 [Octopus sinensis]